MMTILYVMFWRLLLLYVLFKFIPGFWSILDKKTDKIYCYDKDTNPYRYFASKTPYNVIKGSGIELLTDDKCKPAYVLSLIRHPSRYAGDECWKSARMESIRDEILRNDKIELCEEDKNLLLNWKFHGKDADHADISPQGIIQLKEFVERLRDVFGELFDRFPLNEKHFEFITSSKPRCADSCVAFAEQLLHHSTVSLKDTGICKYDDDLIRLKNKREKKKLDVTKDFQTFDEMKKIIHEVSVRLGYEEDLKYEKVYQMYLYCAFDYSWSTETKSAFCAAFEHYHLQVFEYLFDIMAYHARGYGNPNNMYLGEELVRVIIDKLSAAADEDDNDDSKSKLASFYFVHSNTIVPFLKQFDLYNDNESLTKDNFSTKLKNRKFQSSLFDSFGTNIVILLSKCEKETKISFYMNEKALEIPDFNGNVCTLSQLREKFRKRPNNEGTSSNDEPRGISSNDEPRATKRLKITPND